MRALTLLLLAAAALPAHPQFQIQDSHSTASLRGIHALGNGVAWASGTQGTVLHTTDDGITWQTCTTPPDAERLDFRGIQAFDAQTALVMSSGKGDLSRLYKTTNACKTWHLVLANEDQEGFWDTMQIESPTSVEIAGDAVEHAVIDKTTGQVKMTAPRLALLSISPVSYPSHAVGVSNPGLSAEPKEGGFAASNSTLLVGTAPRRDPSSVYHWLATQTPDHSYVHRREAEDATPGRRNWTRAETPMSQGSSSAGIFSLEFREEGHLVAVGGDYQKSDAAVKTAAYSDDEGRTWHLSQTPPHGYRSSVAYDAATKTWITVGPNGTDISTDDGKNWHALKPAAGEAPDADKNWNALSLPFVVGPNGRIGRRTPTHANPTPQVKVPSERKWKHSGGRPRIPLGLAHKVGYDLRLRLS